MNRKSAVRSRQSAEARTPTPETRDPIWTDSERAAWAWKDPVQPSVWCESGDLYIPANAINAEPGAYSFARTPYWREIADLVADPVVQEIWVYKPTQVGFTRLMVNLICYFADQSPGALGLLMPDEDTVDEIFAEEIYPTMQVSPAMKRHLPSRAWDATKREIWLDTMPVFGLYAGSVQKLARRALRYIICDEIDKYRPFKSEASPIQLLKKRLMTWGRRAKAIFGSSPTTPNGNIAQGFSQCADRRRFYVPCPRCGFYQQLLWPQVRGFQEAEGKTKSERAEWVRQHRPCWYECRQCKGRMEESEKDNAVAAGRWASDGQRVEAGKLIGERPYSTKVGVHLNSLPAPNNWLGFSDLAAEFIEADGDLDKRRDFKNAREALPWEDVAKRVSTNVIEKKRDIAPAPGIVPRWAVALYATFDTQHDWFAGTVRAWGWGMKSQLIWHGECHSPGQAGFDEVLKIGLESRWPIEGGGFATPKALLIDSGGDRTEDVYDFALRDPRIFATKGSDSRMRKLWTETEVKPGVLLRIFDTTHFKSALYNLINDPDPTKWLPHSQVSKAYCLEMASENLVIDPKTQKRFWKQSGDSANEAWDLEVLQRAAAEMDNIAAAPPPEEPNRDRDSGMEWTNPLKR